jgi:beta-lactamase superfamily II metal-dependent hydrolase
MKLKLTSRSALLAVATTTMVASGLGVYVWREEHRLPLLEVYIISLSSGQATFIRTPDDKRILIDGGNNGEIIRHISKYLPFYSRRIDILVASNTSGKQVTGLIDVAERYIVDQAYISAHTLESLGMASSTDPIFKELLNTLKKNTIPLERISAGDAVAESGEVSLTALFPVSTQEFAYSKASAPELVLDLVYGKTAISFYGNATRKIQKHLASSTPLIPEVTSRALVVSHNGATNSMSSELIEALRPEYFIYSQTLSYTVSKKNSLKKSLDKTDIEMGKRINLKEHGTIKITSDGEGFQVEYL